MFWTGGTDTNFWALGLEWEKESEDGKGKRKRLQLAVLENDNGDRSLARSLADFLPSFRSCTATYQTSYSGGLGLRCYSEGRWHGRQGISGRTLLSSS